MLQSVTPAWRSATWEFAFGGNFDNQADAQMISKAYEIVHSGVDKLRALAPHSGAYQNEAEIYETDPIGSFWGRENYDKLLAIKKQIDPDNVLTCWNCVGSDNLDPRYRCYPKIK
jgi:FAD/FMN-containing dehydrogenase